MDEHGGHICPTVASECHRTGRDRHPRRKYVRLVAPDFAGPTGIRSLLRLPTRISGIRRIDGQENVERRCSIGIEILR